MSLILLVLFTFILLGFIISEYTGKIIYNREAVNISEVIDGDTVNSEIGKIRLLGINTPERRMPFYSEAKNFTMQILGKKVEIENRGKDKYDRILAYIFLNGNFNAEILKNGLASLYVYKKDEYFSELENAEKYARNNAIGIWKKSNNAQCLKLISLNYIEQKRCNNQEQLIIENICENLSVILKDDANHIVKLNLKAGIFIQNFSCIWNDNGDSLFIRDNTGLLLFYRYSNSEILP